MITNSELCKHICLEKVLWNGILDYVFNLSINYGTEMEQARKT